MDGMPRPRPHHLVREVRNGRTVWYVRVGHGPRIRIRSAYGTPEFAAEYEAAIRGEALPQVGKPRRGSLQWLVDRYRESSEWARLSSATRRQRENVLTRILENVGAEPFDAITRKIIIAGIDRRRETPAAARHFLEALRGVFAWAVYAEIAEVDPTLGVRTPRNKTEGHHIWTAAEVEAYEARWPLGTRERLAFDVLLYTGLRRGDAVRLGRQHENDGMLSIRTEKTGEWAHVPLLPPLRQSIAAGPCGDLTYIAGDRGGNLTKESFGNWFKAACKAAGVPGSAHGLRKVSATRAAQWLTEAQLEAMFAWERGSRVSRVYTNTVDRERLGREAARALTANMLFPHPSSGAGFAAKTKGNSDA